MTKISGSGSKSGSIIQRHGSANPDSLVRSMDSQIRIHTKMSWIRNTVEKYRTYNTERYKIFFRTTGPAASDPRRASVSGDMVSSSSWERTGRRSPAHQRRHASARETGCPAPPRSPRCLLMTPGGASVESVFEDPEEETYSYLEVG
jgi:hypothetical protein